MKFLIFQEILFYLKIELFLRFDKDDLTAI